MTEEKLQKLIDANIPEEWREHCFITEDGMIFTPRFDEEGEMVATGEEAYKQWLEAKDNPVEPEITDKEKIATLEGQVSSLESELMFTNQYVTDLELELFEIKASLQAQ